MIGHEATAEGRFVVALWRDEQQHRGVPVGAEAAHALRYHINEPHPEPSGELRHVAGNRLRKEADMVLPVPLAVESTQVLRQRVVGWDAVGMDIAANVLVAGVEACQTGLDGKAVDGVLVAGFPAFYRGAPGAVFRIAHDGVEAECVVGIEEVDKLARGRGDGAVGCGGNSWTGIGRREGRGGGRDAEGNGIRVVIGGWVERHEEVTHGRSCLGINVFGQHAAIDG